MQYAAERFSADEETTLRPYFTNLDSPVFALVNLPEVVKGALFARYSRSPKSLRRLFLDEFVGDLDLTGDLTVDASIGVSSSSTATTRWPSSGACTSHANRLRTCSPRSSSGAA